MPLLIAVFILLLIFLAVYYSEWRAKPNVNEPSIKPHLEDMPICGNCGVLLESDKLKICPDCGRKIQRREQLITHLESREKQNELNCYGKITRRPFIPLNGVKWKKSAGK